MRVQFEIFEAKAYQRSFLKIDEVNWKGLFEEVARFATKISPERLIGISQSENREGGYANGVVTVWYWDIGAETTPPADEASQ